MKKTITVISTLLLAACGSSGSDSGGEKDSHQLSMGMQTSNLCGQISPDSRYEVIAYGDDGEIISRSVPNGDGQIEATFEQSHVNLMIIRDSGVDTADKKDLDVTYLAQYPVGDLGTLTVKTDDTTACQCETTTVYVIPGNLTSEKLNLPYSGAAFSSVEAKFNNVQLCEVEENVEALMVANHLDSDSGFIYYQALETPSQYINHPIDAIAIPILESGQIGRGVTVNTIDNAVHRISYVTDQKHNYSVRAQINGSLYVLDHERVDKVELHAVNQLDSLGLPDPARIWGVRIPMTDDTTDILYSKPEFEPELLTSFFNNPKSAYNLEGEQYRVITGAFSFNRPDGSIDDWHYILPSQSSIGADIELPADYLVDLPEGTDYRSLASHQLWDLNEISAIGSLDELYQSDWLKIFLPTASEISVRPPAAFSYVSLQLDD